MINTNLRLLFLSSNLPWRGGGTFYRAMGFARYLVKRGHQVTFLLTSLEQKRNFVEEIVDGVHLVQAPSLLSGKLRSGWDPFEINRRINWLKNKEFDIVHGFESRPTVIYPALSASRNQNTKLLLDWCDWLGKGGLVEERPKSTRLILSPVETYYEENFRLRADGTTVINTTLEQRAISLGVLPKTIHWLPNGAEIHKVKVLPRDESREALGLPIDAKIIGHLGHAFPDDAKLMSDSLNKINETNSDINLLFIGDYRKRLAAQFDLKSKIINTGYVEGLELNQYLAACDLLWLPLKNTVNNRGRWPMKVSDYLASGRPIVSTATGDLPKLFQNEHPAGLMAEDNVQSFSKKTLLLLADEAKRFTCGQNARYIAENIFNWEIISEELEAFYLTISENTNERVI